MSTTNAFRLDDNQSRPWRAARSAWRRAATAGALAGLILLLAGDRGASTAVPAGIDPLEVLNLQVRANAIILLDSSGSMRDRTDFRGFSAGSPSAGEVVGDEQNSKMFAAKRVLKQIIQDNQAKVSFEFGRYQQGTTAFGPENPAYLYTCVTSAASPETSCTAAAADHAFNFSDGGVPAANFFRADTDEKTVGSATTYHLFANRYHVNVRYQVQGDNTTLCPGTNPTTITGTGSWSPPSPATDWNQPGTEPPFIEIERFGGGGCGVGQPSTVARYYFRGVFWRKGNDVTSGTSAEACGGYASQVALAACATTDQITAIGPFLTPEVVPTATDGDTLANLRAGTNGIRASGPTPLAEALLDIKSDFDANKWGGAGNIQGLTPKPRTFVIILTDGDDSCNTSLTFNASGSPLDVPDSNTLRAAYDAQVLYAGVGATPDPASRVQTYVIALGGSASANRANWMAWGGSGMTRATTGSGTATAWASAPTAADRAACATCTDAFFATDATDLKNALQTVIDQGQSTGEFSDQQSITESIYEFAASVTLPSPSPGASPVPSPDPRRPDTRYNATVPILLQSTFEMPGFKGHLNAFRNVSGAAAPAWAATLAGSDSAQKLQDRVAANLGTGSWRFDQLRGGTSSTDLTIGAVAVAVNGAIRRRIYTTPQNGVFAYASYNSSTRAYTGGRSDTQAVTDLQDNDAAAGSGPVTFRIPIWPPNAAVDPAGTSGSSYPAGILDNALGIGASPPPTLVGGTSFTALTFAQLQTQFSACTASSSGGGLPADCSSAALRLDAARREARQIILAYTAGAALITSNTAAVRTGSAGCTPIGAVGDGVALATCGALQFRARTWIQAESTLAAPGVITAPVQSAPSSHNAEYQVYRDGPRTSAGIAANGTLLGFGLRNPDKDGTDAAGTTRMTLKPVMSVVYHATNGMLHAFRAGQCTDASGGTNCQNGGSEIGGEELWAFVPFDQLQNLKERMKPQARDPHTYMLAAPVRFADVFVPGSFSRSVGGVTVSGAGVWRTFLVFGRGIAGKYLTALDVTAPGAFTEGSLYTKPPIPVWSRGNPDTFDGTSTDTANNSVTSTDGTAYAKMGQTWSVPAIAFVSAASNTTSRRSGGVEFVAYAGSGYGSGSNATNEGSTFYTLDMLTGDVVASADITPRSGAAFANALVAGPSVFSPNQLRPGFVGNSATSQATRVYFPDIQGRIWRVLTTDPSTTLAFADLGAQQPVGNSLALLNYVGTGTVERPHVFAESGNDNRVTPPPADTPPFRMWALRDDDLATDPSSTDGVDGPAVLAFTIDFPSPFRGNVQPATAFNDASPPQGRVFFAGNRFNAPGTANAPSPPPCRSSFDAIFFALGAATGNAAYDLNSSGDDRSIIKSNQRVQAVRVAGGRLVLDTGLNADVAPPPPAAPAQTPGSGPLANVVFGPQATASELVKQGPVTFKLGSSVCK